MAPAYRIIPLGDSAITIDFGNVIDETINHHVILLLDYWRRKNLPGIMDLIPAYSSFTLVYDVSVIRKLFNVDDAYSFLNNQLEDSIMNIEWKVISSPRKEIPICYDISLAPDLESLSEQKKLSVEEIILLHSIKMYRVFMIGFLPGFAYMGTVDERLATPRKQKPAALVRQGSVGIAGGQTGIYPFDSPGGWHIIGQTPLNLFDARKKNPALLNPGDEVQFIRITLKEFEHLKNIVIQ